MPERIYAAIHELEKGELFFHHSNLYVLLESTDSVIAEQGIEKFDLTNGKLKARSVGFNSNLKWLNHDNGHTENFWAETEVLPLNFLMGEGFNLNRRKE